MYSEILFICVIMNICFRIVRFLRVILVWISQDLWRHLFRFVQFCSLGWTLNTSATDQHGGKAWNQTWAWYHHQNDNFCRLCLNWWFTKGLLFFEAEEEEGQQQVLHRYLDHPPPHHPDYDDDHHHPDSDHDDDHHPDHQHSHDWPGLTNGEQRRGKLSVGSKPKSGKTGKLLIVHCPTFLYHSAKLSSLSSPISSMKIRWINKNLSTNSFEKKL